MSPLDDHESEDDFSEEEMGWDDLPVAIPGELTPAPWLCAACGRQNETLVDLSSGFKQQYVEDCSTCCRPNLITLDIEEESLQISLRNELEYE